MRVETTNGISTLLRDPRELHHPSFLGGPSGKTAIYEPGYLSSPDTETANTLTLDFLVSRTVRNVLVFVYKPPSLWYSFRADKS